MSFSNSSSRKHIYRVMKGYNKSICCSILCNSKKEKQLKDVYKNGMPKETIHKMAYYIPVKMDVYML